MSTSKQKSKQLKNQVININRACFVVAATKDCLQVDKNRINFCKYPIFASSFKQITATVELLDVFAQQQQKEFHLLKISSSSNPIPSIQNDRVFTFKLVQTGEQQTDFQVPIKAGQPLQIIIRAQIPQLELSTDISGLLSLTVDQFEPMQLPIVARGEVPQIICLKQMMNEKTGRKVVKIPSKNIMKIPFKNSSNINFFFELKLLGKDQQNPDSDGVKLKIIPNQPGPKLVENKQKGKQSFIIKVDANSTFCITLQFELLKKDGSIRVARRILLLQVQGTKLFFPFPLQVIISQ